MVRHTSCGTVLAIGLVASCLFLCQPRVLQAAGLGGSQYPVTADLFVPGCEPVTRQRFRGGDMPGIARPCEVFASSAQLVSCRFYIEGCFSLILPRSLADSSFAKLPSNSREPPSCRYSNPRQPHPSLSLTWLCNRRWASSAVAQHAQAQSDRLDKLLIFSLRGTTPA